jgi:hypothetical protein
MSFLYPAFLWGFLAIALPIIVHLFNFRRVKRVYFSNNAFLNVVKKATSSKLRLKHLLILLSRILFIVFLVLTFAQPFIPRGNEQGSVSNDQLIYVYLDNSLSMSSPVQDNVRGIDLGARLVEELTDVYPRNTQYKLLTNDFAELSRLPKSAGEINDQVAGTDFSGSTRTFEEIYERVKADLDDQNTATDAATLYMITDFQQSTLGPLNTLAGDTSLSVNLVPVRSATPKNVYVDSVYLDNPFVLNNSVNKLRVDLRNDGNVNAENIILRLLVNEQQVATASADVARNSVETLVFDLNIPLKRFNRCQLQFEDFPVTFDNNFYFTLSTSGQVNVLEITGGQTGSGEEKTPIEKVYANKEVFSFATYSVTNLDYSLIDNADLIVLNEVSYTGASTNAINAITPYLQDFLAEGGFIFYVPNASGDVQFLKNLSNNDELSISRVFGQQDSLTSNPLAGIDFSNPFFNDMFKQQETRVAMPSAVKLFNVNLSGEPLLRYKTGDPFLLRLNSRLFRTSYTPEKQVFYVNTPLHDEYTRFHRHALFVPVMYRIASLSKTLTGNLYFSVSEPTVSVPVNSLITGDDLQNQTLQSVSKRSIFELVKNNQQIIPGQRVSGSQLVLDLPRELVEPGFYNLMMSNSRQATAGEGQRQVLQSISFNYDKSESLIAAYSEEELNQQFGGQANINIYETGANAENFVNRVKEKEASISLWKYMLILALFFLLAEVLLIRFL